MGRSACCEKDGMKKGPWTPEEDIVLVSYIQEHGPGNWRMISSHTGLLRCSKSCRLRWTNYLRPGIKRGNFTPYEDRVIMHLQALLGNRWAAIASYLPQRTDNDIKNYWNTHLKKRLKKLQTQGIGRSNEFTCDNPFKRSPDLDGASKGQWEARLQTNIDLAKQALQEALCMGSSSVSYSQDSGITTNSDPLPTRNMNSAVYACSTMNLSRLLEGWKDSSVNKKKSPSIGDIPAATTSVAEYSSSGCSDGYHSHETSQHNSAMPVDSEMEDLNSLDQDEILRLISLGSYGDREQSSLNVHNVDNSTDNHHQNSPDSKLPFFLLEKWLMEETCQPDQLLYSFQSGTAV